MIEVYSNNAQTTLAANINSTATSCTLLSGSGALFPSPAAGQFFRLTLIDALTGVVREITYCTARTGDVCTIVRGQEGTTAHSYLSGDSADNLPTAGAMSNLVQQQQAQQNILNYASDSGSANAYVLTLPSGPGLATPVPGAPIYFYANNANTGASTVRVSGGSVYPLLGMARAPLQGGEILTECLIIYEPAAPAYVLVWSAGGKVQAPNATKSQQAVPLGQAQQTFAALAGSGTQPFSTSNLVTSSITQGAQVNVNFFTSSGLISYNIGGTGYTPVYGSTDTTNGLSYVNWAKAQATYAQLAGSPGQAFYTGHLFSNYLDAGGNIMYLASNQYTASVTSLVSGYVPHLVAASTIPNAAVPLSYGQAIFANITGNPTVTFQTYNLGISGNSIVSNTGGMLYLQANGGAIVTNNGASALAPFQAAPGGAGNQVVNFSQFQLGATNPGYQRLPSGLIIQWGTGASQGGGVNNFYPVVFPTACTGGGVCVIGNNGYNGDTVQVTQFNNNGFTAWGGSPVNGGGAPPGVAFTYVVIGF
jgi:hypothetical protein